MALKAESRATARNIVNRIYVGGCRKTNVPGVRKIIQGIGNGANVANISQRGGQPKWGGFAPAHRKATQRASLLRMVVSENALGSVGGSSLLTKRRNASQTENPINFESKWLNGSPRYVTFLHCNFYLQPNQWNEAATQQNTFPCLIRSNKGMEEFARIVEDQVEQMARNYETNLPVTDTVRLFLK